MARDRHPRARSKGALTRKQGTRPPYERVLIVCEGKKTEPLYFEDIRRQFHVPSAHVRVCWSDTGTQPRQVVDHAEQEFLKTRAYERVFAVFDRDDHTTYDAALQRAAALDNTLRNDERKFVRFSAVPTVPCFELWLLLHFVDVHAFSHRTDVIRTLGDHLAGYSKGAPNIYRRTEEHLPLATRRAQRLRERFEPTPGDDPYTDVDTVVALLRALRT